MSLRDIVSGVGCDVGSSSSSSNPISSFLQRPLEDFSRIQDHNEYGDIAGPSSSKGQGSSSSALHYGQVPGHLVHEGEAVDKEVDSYLDSFGPDQARQEFQDFSSVYEDAWSSQQPLPGQQLEAPTFGEEDVYNFEQEWNQALEAAPADPVSGFLHSFIHSARNQAPVPMTQLPDLGLSQEDRVKIRDRTGIMARHFYPDQNETFVEAQVRSVLDAFGIVQEEIGDAANFERYYNEANNVTQAPPEEETIEHEWLKEYEEKNVWVDEYTSFETRQQAGWADSASGKVVETTNGFATLAEPLSDSEAWANEFADLRSLPLPDDDQIEANGMGGYQFARENPYLALTDALDQGVRLFNEGNLIEAQQALEAAAQQDPSSVEAWRKLGECHAEMDEDRKAIASYQRALSIDPHDLPSLMALGVSYTNELDQQHALNFLRTWIHANPTYSSMVEHLSNQIGGGDGENLQEEVTRLFCEAAKENSADADVFTVLGVLYNLSREYDNAVDCLERAAQLNSQSYSLWNKLGATLANSYRNEEAVSAYQKAIDRKPSYLRAWANLGICFSNQGLYGEAANNYLRALRLNPSSDHIWSNLSIAFTCMGRNDLVERSERHDMTLLDDQF